MNSLSRFRNRLGDFWWYTILLFFAARAGDLINAFIGLWLVPHYVSVNELGAVLPLSNFSTFLALPIAVFALAFAKQVNVLSVHGEWGKLKTMLRSVFIAAGVFILFAVLLLNYVFPIVLERVRVARGALGIVIVAAALASTMAPLYLNTLQALKRFKNVASINFWGAPIRLGVMLVTMPIRALTGYFCGQAAAPCFQVCASIFCLRKELGPAVKAEPYWTKQVVVSFVKYVLLIALSISVMNLVGFIEPLVIRQRLPEIDSAAFYMISRFAEIGSYLGLTLVAVLFPYVSESNENGKGGDLIIVRSMLGALAFGVLCALGFMLVGRWLFVFLPNGETYVRYLPELGVLTIVLAVNMVVGCFTTGETAANRFRWLWWYVPCYLIYAGFLLLVTGYGYLDGIAPATWVDAIASLHASRLRFILGSMVVFACVRLVCCTVQLLIRKVFPTQK